MLLGWQPFPVGSALCWTNGSARLSFTHGDYQPRNWLSHAGAVSVIDFGRGTQRPWVSDLIRLRNQQFVGRPDLEDAFMTGLGRRSRSAAG